MIFFFDAKTMGEFPTVKNFYKQSSNKSLEKYLHGGEDYCTNKETLLKAKKVTRHLASDQLKVYLHPLYGVLEG